MWPLRRRPLTITAKLFVGILVTRAELAEDCTEGIRPLMTMKCYECHAAAKTKGDLNRERFCLQAAPATA
jgi:hypothetical protein